MPEPRYFTPDNASIKRKTLCEPADPERLRLLRVEFPVAGRTFWHIHHDTQILIVVEGVGFYQHAQDKVARKIVAGDTVYIPAGEKHWHGAAPNSAMTHVVINGTQRGGETDWLEEVSDAEYLRVSTPH